MRLLNFEVQPPNNHMMAVPRSVRVDFLNFNSLRFIHSQCLAHTWSYMSAPKTWLTCLAFCLEKVLLWISMLVSVSFFVWLPEFHLGMSELITIIGPESNPPTFTENNKLDFVLHQHQPGPEPPCSSCGQTVKTPWFAIICGLEVGVRHTWWVLLVVIVILTYMAF